MPRIYIETDDLRLNRLDEIGGQLTKGRDLSPSKMRSFALDYLVDTVTQAHNAIASLQAEISQLKERVTDQDSSDAIQAKLDSLREQYDALEDKCRHKATMLSRAEDGIEGMLSTIGFLVERVKEYEL